MCYIWAYGAENPVVVFTFMVTFIVTFMDNPPLKYDIVNKSVHKKDQNPFFYLKKASIYLENMPASVPT